LKGVAPSEDFDKAIEKLMAEVAEDFDKKIEKLMAEASSSVNR
jgi:hypothetical protein